MKTYYRTHCPEQIECGGLIYKIDLPLTQERNEGKDYENTAFKENKKIIHVEVLANNLKRRLDLHDQPYKPHTFVYSVFVTPTYKVVKVMMVSERRQILERGLTREEAMRVVKRYPNSSRSMVVFQKESL